MAIQLSERDMMIFKFIEEHHVLLEKHIAWFISCDEKPVLIRDRLRKLFYLDYLLCQRHAGKLPWWTTPTKPLVYMLSPMARGMVSSSECEMDLSDTEIQRHLLEIANLRMIFLTDQKSGLIEDLNWTTMPSVTELAAIAATVSFKRNGSVHRAALINNIGLATEKVRAAAEKAIADGTADMIWIISSDDANQEKLQQALVNSSVANRMAFATHQEVYKAGVVKSKWQSVGKQFAPVIAESVVAPMNMSWNPTMATPA
ncbi:MAG: hypothetical protein K2X27_06520 [Candidatus Obscuribacterales bacterium]|nr:hypothetical protein [Candidatus Obscuribacterales bacterium]